MANITKAMAEHINNLETKGCFQIIDKMGNYLVLGVNPISPVEVVTKDSPKITEIVNTQEQALLPKTRETLSAKAEKLISVLSKKVDYKSEAYKSVQRVIKAKNVEAGIDKEVTKVSEAKREAPAAMKA